MIGKARLAAAVLYLTVCHAVPGALAEDPLERGRYLMNGIVACGNCHTVQTPQGPLAGMELAGGMKIEDAGFTAMVPNITPDKETGIGNWTDEQIIAAIREGKRPDGAILGPPMAFEQYRHMSDEDVRALVAYIRSVKPISNKVPRSTYNFPLPPAWAPPVTSVAAVAPTDPGYGAYLAGPLGHCVECHSGPNAQGIPDIEHKLGAGGIEFKGPWGTSVAANITPTNLGSWTDEQIKTVIRTGVRPDGSRLMPPMGIGYYASISDSDLDALVGYLRALPPL